MDSLSKKYADSLINTTNEALKIYKDKSVAILTGYVDDLPFSIILAIMLAHELDLDLYPILSKDFYEMYSEIYASSKDKFEIKTIEDCMHWQNPPCDFPKGLPKYTDYVEIDGLTEIHKLDPNSEFPKYVEKGILLFAPFGYPSTCGFLGEEILKRQTRSKILYGYFGKPNNLRFIDELVSALIGFHSREKRYEGSIPMFQNSFVNSYYRDFQKGFEYQNLPVDPFPQTPEEQNLYFYDEIGSRMRADEAVKRTIETFVIPSTQRKRLLNGKWKTAWKSKDAYTEYREIKFHKRFFKIL